MSAPPQPQAPEDPDESARLRERIAALEAAPVPAPADTTAIETVALLESLLDTSAVGVGFLDTDLRYQRVNRALVEINGRSADEHIGRTVGELFPEVEDELGAAMQRVLETGTSITNIERTGATRGSPSYGKHLLVNLHPVHLPGGAIAGIGVMVADISARKQAELVTQALADASRIFAESALDTTRSMDAVARTLVDRLGDACLVWLLSDDERTRYIAAMHHSDPDALTLMRDLADAAPPQPSASWKLRSEVPEFFPIVPPATMQERIWKPLWPYLDRYPIHSLIAIPMVVRGRMIGAVRLSRDITPHAYTDVDFRFAIELAERAALAIDNARLYAAEQQSRVLAEVAEARYRGIFENTADALVILDSHGNYVDANPAALEQSGYTLEELRGMASGSLATDYVEAEIAARFEAVRRDGVVRGETEIRRKDGTSITVEGVMSMVPLGSGDNVEPIFISSTRDISERRKLERMQQEFISMVTHELKIPLTGIRGYAQLMQRRGIYIARGIDSIIEQTHRLDRLINDLLDSARLEAGRLEMQRAPTDLVAVARGVAEAVQTLTDGHAILIDTTEITLVGQLDRGRTQQIIENLLSNAVKYSPDGGDIIIRIKRGADDTALFSVRDHGLGIAASDIPSLFSRFARLDSALTSKAPGLGLGLYITKSLVEAQGGRIWVESEPGRGSTFSVSLPLVGERKGERGKRKAGRDET